MTTQKRILVASTPDGRHRAQQALSKKYDLQFVSTVREAESLLSEHGHSAFDLIICGIHFDDSRIFELLEFVRHTDHFDNLPFLVFQAQHGDMSVMASVKRTAQTLGACGFIELQNLPPAQANKRLQDAVKEAFDKPVKYARTDS